MMQFMKAALEAGETRASGAGLISQLTRPLPPPDNPLMNSLPTFHLVRAHAVARLRMVWRFAYRGLES